MDKQREQAILRRLWELQAEHGYSDSDLARELDVHASLINHMKAGRRGLGMKPALAAAAKFPELREMLLAEMPTGIVQVPVVMEKAAS